MKAIQWGPAHTTVFCEITGETIRPYIPVSLRELVFGLFHRPAHPSERITDRLIRQRYVWPEMHRDIANWCRTCTDCQQSKVSRHVRQAPGRFVAPDGRFNHVHIDIVGPLPAQNGFSYCLTMIDRFSRWVEAVPLREISAQAVAEAFFDSWVSRYGAPKILTTDQGAQFESRLFTALLSFIGCERIRITAYHPASNGMIERWHRVFKAAIMCHSDTNWPRTLPTVLLGLRSHVRSDTGASPAEFLFGTTLRLPGEFFLPDDFVSDPNIFINEFREYMRLVRPVPVAHKYKTRAFVFKELHSCSHVFLRNMVKNSLERPYTGPHKVLQRVSERVFKIEVNGAAKCVSVELLKPAHLIADDLVDSGLPDGGNDDGPPVASRAPPILRTYERKRITFAPMPKTNQTCNVKTD